MKQVQYSHDERRRISYLLLHLIGDYYHETISEVTVEDRDLDAMYTIARSNSLCAFTAAILRSRGIRSERFSVAHAKAQRKSLLYDKELAAFSKAMNKRGIRFLPLKGMSLKSLYPGVGLREMSDIDILIQKDSAESVREIMLDMGYTVESFNKTNHDVYHKPPFFCVEIHRSLFDQMIYPELERYFDEKDYFSADDNSVGMSADEFYIYLVAHAYQHYNLSGTGLRTLLDFHLLLQKYGSELDFQYIENELKTLDMSEFEHQLRRLAKDLFRPETFDDEWREELDNYIFAGVYGNYNRYIRNRIERRTTSQKHWKTEYIASRLRITPRHIRNSPFFSKHPSLSWMLTVVRPVKMIVTRPDKVKREWKELIHYKKK